MLGSRSLCNDYVCYVNLWWSSKEKNNVFGNQIFRLIVEIAEETFAERYIQKSIGTFSM